MDPRIRAELDAAHFKGVRKLEADRGGKPVKWDQWGFSVDVPSLKTKTILDVEIAPDKSDGDVVTLFLMPTRFANGQQGTASSPRIGSNAMALIQLGNGGVFSDDNQGSFIGTGLTTDWSEGTCMVLPAGRVRVDVINNTVEGAGGAGDTGDRNFRAFIVRGNAQGGNNSPTITTSAVALDPAASVDVVLPVFAEELQIYRDDNAQPMTVQFRNVAGTVVGTVDLIAGQNPPLIRLPRIVSVLGGNAANPRLPTVLIKNVGPVAVNFFCVFGLNLG